MSERRDHTEKKAPACTAFPGLPEGGSEDQVGKTPTPPTPTRRPLTRLGGVLSAQGLVASNLNLKPGECLKVRGEVAPDAKR